MTLPNFLIIGAAKSGTTSLFNYLGQHPQVYTRAKEPGFFAYEGQSVRLAGPEDQTRFDQRVITDRQQYEALFADMMPGQVCGEASVAYMYVDGTAERIKQHVPNVRLIAILRNPVDRAFSSYWHLRRDGREPLVSFAEGLAAEGERIQANWDYIWHYARVGCYYEQLQRYYNLFPRERIAIFLFEKFKRNPVQIVQAICRFLEIDDSFQPDFSLKYNVSGKPRWNWLDNFTSRPNQLKRLARPFIPLRLRKRWGTQLRTWNLETQIPTMPDEVMQALAARYRDDTLRLQDLVGKDFSGWLSDERR